MTQSIEPNDIRDRLARLDGADFSPRRFEFSSTARLRQAEVLIPLFVENSTFSLLFVRRSADVEDHPGEVAFPGGSIEPEDRRPGDAAVREAREEVGLEPKDVQIFGEFASVPVVTGYKLNAYVGELENATKLKPTSTEIESVFSVTVDELLEPGRHRVEQRDFRDQTFEVHFFEAEADTIWGATGYLVYLLLDFLGFTLEPVRTRSSDTQ